MMDDIFINGGKSDVESIFDPGRLGATGSKTVECLLEAGVKVRAYVHRQDERSAALSALGADAWTILFGALETDLLKTRGSAREPIRRCCPSLASPFV